MNWSPVPSCEGHWALVDSSVLDIRGADRITIRSFCPHRFSLSWFCSAATCKQAKHTLRVIAPASKSSGEYFRASARAISHGLSVRYNNFPPRRRSTDGFGGQTFWVPALFWDIDLLRSMGVIRDRLAWTIVYFQFCAPWSSPNQVKIASRGCRSGRRCF